MERRRVLFLIAPVMIALLLPAGFAAPAPAKEATVTLTVTGMT